MSSPVGSELRRALGFLTYVSPRVVMGGGGNDENVGSVQYSMESTALTLDFRACSEWRRVAIPELAQMSAPCDFTFRCGSRPGDQGFGRLSSSFRSLGRAVVYTSHLPRRSSALRGRQISGRATLFSMCRILSSLATAPDVEYTGVVPGMVSVCRQCVLDPLFFGRLVAI